MNGGIEGVHTWCVWQPDNKGLLTRELVRGLARSASVMDETRELDTLAAHIGDVQVWFLVCLWKALFETVKRSAGTSIHVR